MHPKQLLKNGSASLNHTDIFPELPPFLELTSCFSSGSSTVSYGPHLSHKTISLQQLFVQPSHRPHQTQRSVVLPVPESRTPQREIDSNFVKQNILLLTIFKSSSRFTKYFFNNWTRTLSPSRYNVSINLFVAFDSSYNSLRSQVFPGTSNIIASSSNKAFFDSFQFIDLESHLPASSEIHSSLHWEHHFPENSSKCSVFS